MEYTIISDPYEKEDDTFITEEQINKIYSAKNIFEINKNNFLNSYYEKASTKQTEYYLYNSTILHNEQIKNKDISEFTTAEIKELIENIPTSSKGQQNRVFKFINQYCKWMITMDKINLNPCEGLKSKNFNTNVDALKNKIIGLDKFWDMIDEMLAKDCHVQLVLPLVLSRYGIYGKNAWDLLNLKYSQINEKEKIVTLYYEDGNFKTSILVDEKFINIINKSKIENVVNSIYRGIYLAIIKFNNLVKSRKLDFLLNIRSKRRINTEDVLNTIRLFEPKMSKGSYHSLVKDIEILTGEKVLYKYEKGVKLIDPNSKAFVDNIVKDLKFEGYII